MSLLQWLFGRRPAPDPAVPAYYDQWLPLLRQLHTGLPDPELLRRMEQGTLAGGEAELELFADELARTLDAMLADACGTFRRQMQLNEGRADPEELVRAFRKLRARLENCLFFERLAFLPAAKKQALGGQVRRYALSYWQNAVAVVRAAADEGHDPALEDTLFQLRRLTPFAEETVWELL